MLNVIRSLIGYFNLDPNRLDLNQTPKHIRNRFKQSCGAGAEKITKFRLRLRLRLLVNCFNFFCRLNCIRFRFYLIKRCFVFVRCFFSYANFFNINLCVFVRFMYFCYILTQSATEAFSDFWLTFAEQQNQLSKYSYLFYSEFSTLFSNRSSPRQTSSSSSSRYSMHFSLIGQF